MAQVASKPKSNHIDRVATLKWVPLALMRVSPLAQRELNQARVDKIVANFDPEQIGTPTVNKRGEIFYIIDGQHRIEAMREVGWGDQQLQCWTYEGLSEKDEAEMFLKLNDTLAVPALAKYRVGVVAGRADVSAIDKIVHACGLHVSLNKSSGSVSCVGTLLRIYNRSDAGTLHRTLELVRDAYGDSGMSAAVIDGVAFLIQRYDEKLDDEVFVTKMGNAHGGVAGLLNKGEIIRRQTGASRGHAVAAAAVEIYNATRGGNKLANWWKSEDGE